MVAGARFGSVQVRYAVSAKEWREARYLHRTRGRRSSADSWAILLILVPLVGAVGDILHTVSTDGFSAQGSVLPLLLLLASASAAALLWMAHQRDRRAGQRSGITLGEWTANITENGFERFREGWPSDHPSRVVHGWQNFHNVQVGRRVIILELRDDPGFEAVPLRALTQEEQSWFRRMTARKLKPARSAEESRTGFDQDTAS